MTSEEIRQKWLAPWDWPGDTGNAASQLNNCAEFMKEIAAQFAEANELRRQQSSNATDNRWITTAEKMLIEIASQLAESNELRRQQLERTPTIRMQLVMAAMQGMVSKVGLNAIFNPSLTIKGSFQLADAMIAAEKGESRE